MDEAISAAYGCVGIGEGVHHGSSHNVMITFLTSYTVSLPRDDGTDPYRTTTIESLRYTRDCDSGVYEIGGGGKLDGTPISWKLP